MMNSLGLDHDDKLKKICSSRFHYYYWGDGRPVYNLLGHGVTFARYFNHSPQFFFSPLYLEHLFIYIIIIITIPR